MWRNGRRKRLKIARETMWVRVPPSASSKQSGLFSGSGLLYFCCKSHLCVLRENADDGIGRGPFAGEIQVCINIACCADVAVPQPLLDFLQAHAIGIEQTGTTMAQIVKADTLHLVCDQKIREMLTQKVGPNPLSHRVDIDQTEIPSLSARVCCVSSFSLRSSANRSPSIA